MDHFARVAEITTTLGATALVVSASERTLLETGASSTTVHCRSIRKSLLGSLFARPLADGRLDLDATLVDLDIDDSVAPGLSREERSARLRHLLSSSSGIYHPANHAGPDGGVASLPPRGSRKPGELFRYNNWDFNALGTILEQAVGRSMFKEFDQAIARPAGMTDFDPGAQHYDLQQWSEHRTYAFHISTRDLARFGQLYLNQGRAEKRQVVPAAWVRESTRPHIQTGRGPAYGYLWWVAYQGELFAGVEMPRGSFAAYGAGGQFLLVIPELDRVIAMLADPTRPEDLDRAALRSGLAELVHHATEGTLAIRDAHSPRADSS